jgi:tetratricopeptide (TPR) repeat protein
MRQARQLIEHAIALDPTFAEARAILGLHFFLHAVLGLRPARDVVPTAKEHLAAALHIDHELPEAHAALGVLACLYDYDWADAARRFERARLRDAVVFARFVREVSEAMFLAIVGRHAQAVELLRQSIKQDPLNPSPYGSLGNVLASAGRLDEAAAAYRRGLELNERSIFAYEGLTIIHASQGRFTEALAAAEKAHALAPWNATGIGMLAGCLQRAGDADRSQEVLRLLGNGHQFGAPIGFAIHPAINDEAEAGAEWLEKAITERDPRAIVFVVLPTGHVWRRSARWPTLAKTLNLASAVA